MAPLMPSDYESTYGTFAGSRSRLAYRLDRHHRRDVAALTETTIEGAQENPSDYARIADSPDEVHRS